MNSAGNLVALNTIVRREIMRIMRIWTQTLIPPAITMTLYFVIFGKLIGSRIGQMHGFTYMQYIVPGLVMMSIITNSYGNISSSFFGAKFSRAVEEMLVSPMPNWVILLGYVIGAVARGVIVGALVLVIALFFTDLHVVHPIITFLSVLLGATVFSLAGFVNAVFAKKFDDIALVPTFVLTPLTYLGGVFYSVDLLGEPWRSISMVNPILYMVNAFRFGVLGVSDVQIGVAFAVMLAFVIGLSIVALQLLKRGVGLRSYRERLIRCASTNTSVKPESAPVARRTSCCWPDGSPSMAKWSPPVPRRWRVTR
jgi:ABC-2 type transport system permease protein